MANHQGPIIHHPPHHPESRHHPNFACSSFAFCFFLTENMGIGDGDPIRLQPLPGGLTEFSKWLEERRFKGLYLHPCLTIIHQSCFACPDVPRLWTDDQRVLLTGTEIDAQTGLSMVLISFLKFVG